MGAAGEGVRPEGPSGGGQPDVRQEHPELPAGPRLRRTGRVVLPPRLLDRHEHADTATARPGAPREPAGTVPAPAHAAPAPSDAGLRGLDRTVRAACHTVSLRRFPLLKRTELHFPKQIVYHVKTLIKTFALIIRLCAAISLSLGFNGAQLGHMLTQPHCPVLNAISEH